MLRVVHLYPAFLASWYVKERLCVWRWWPRFFLCVRVSCSSWSSSEHREEFRHWNSVERIRKKERERKHNQDSLVQVGSGVGESKSKGERRRRKRRRRRWNLTVDFVSIRMRVCVLLAMSLSPSPSSRRRRRRRRRRNHYLCPVPHRNLVLSLLSPMAGWMSAAGGRCMSSSSSLRIVCVTFFFSFLREQVGGWLGGCRL